MVPGCQYVTSGSRYHCILKIYVFNGGSRISQTEGPHPKLAALAYYLANFFPKTVWKWKKLNPKGSTAPPRPPPPLDPKMRLVMGDRRFTQVLDHFIRSRDLVVRTIWEYKGTHHLHDGKSPKNPPPVHSNKPFECVPDPSMKNCSMEETTGGNNCALSVYDTQLWAIVSASITVKLLPKMGPGPQWKEQSHRLPYLLMKNEPLRRLTKQTVGLLDARVRKSPCSAQGQRESGGGDAAAGFITHYEVTPLCTHYRGLWPRG